MWIENEKANEPFIKKTVCDLPKYDLKVPAIVVGAGYGIDEQIPVIRTYGKPIIISTDKAHTFFRKHDAAPDYVVALNTEETEDVHVAQWLGSAEEATNLILPVTAHPSHMRHWLASGGGEVYWVVPSNIDDDLSFEWSKKYNVYPIHRGANSGEFAFLMAAQMGCSPVGLVGMPYAWKTLVEVLDQQSPEFYEYHEFCQDGKHCYTTLGFMEQRAEFLEVVRMFSRVYDENEKLIPWVKTFNCSEGGILYDSEVLPRKDLKDFLKEFC